MRHLLLAVSLLAATTTSLRAQDAAPYHLQQTLHIGGKGGWDYLTADPEHKLLYVTRSTHVMVVDASTDKLVADIPGQKGNHGVAIAPDAGRGFITDGKDASVVIFDLKTNHVLGKIKAAEDADGILYDPASNKILLVCGDSGVLIPISPDIDLATGKADPPIELGGKPEFFAVDAQGKAFVNLEDKNQIAVVDTHTMKVLAHWPVAPGGAPTGMAIDRQHGLLFIGCRKPQKMIVMDCTSGKILADLPIGAGVDATQFDDGYALASCRDGTLTVIKESSPNQFEVVQTLQTKPGARTMGLDPITHTVYLPTAEYDPATLGQRRPTAKPDSFMILTVTRDH
ncbi:MAG TPA: hypothetical protein VFE58_09970 [Tepidisphaeraceae bacterium]|jgi:DNA-binding beta-propeller fold protein YncE|nr:hypothetical protein [Tepidisphaeraceae bacterium]